MKKKLLIIEDERSISDIIVVNAELAGYECDTAYDGEAGLRRGRSNKYDLILLDLMLPKIDGFEICKQLRKENISTPIIMVTAREEEIDKVLGLELGADDYITKPFGVKELLARIKAHIRRSSSEPMTETSKGGDNTTKLHSLVIHESNYRVEKNGAPLELSKIEYDLLAFFAKNPGRIFSREDLLTNVWKYDDYVGDVRTVDVTIRRLRVKIEDNPAKPQIIQTKRGVGWYVNN